MPGRNIFYIFYIISLEPFVLLISRVYMRPSDYTKRDTYKKREKTKKNIARMTNLHANVKILLCLKKQILPLQRTKKKKNRTIKKPQHNFFKKEE